MAFLAIALSGHANSAEPRPLAVATDWLHLLAGAVWMGGLAQIASAGRDRRQPLRPAYSRGATAVRRARAVWAHCRVGRASLDRGAMRQALDRRAA